MQKTAWKVSVSNNKSGLRRTFGLVLSRTNHTSHFYDLEDLTAKGKDCQAFVLFTCPLKLDRTIDSGKRVKVQHVARRCSSGKTRFKLTMIMQDVCNQRSSL